LTLPRLKDVGFLDYACLDHDYVSVQRFCPNPEVVFLMLLTVGAKVLGFAKETYASTMGFLRSLSSGCQSPVPGCNRTILSKFTLTIRQQFNSNMVAATQLGVQFIQRINHVGFLAPPYPRSSVSNKLEKTKRLFTFQQQVQHDCSCEARVVESVKLQLHPPSLQRINIYKSW
jgi:hypothetical protein